MKILVSAIERSANIHLKELLSHMNSDIEISGIFDKSLGEPIVDMQDRAVMGIVSALKSIPFFLKLAERMVEESKNADKVLLIDGSGFNLPLAKKIKKRYPEKEIIYYILPQAWAWRRYRIPVLEKNIDKLASILPFEKSFYSSEANIKYVGHPLLDEIKKFKDSISNENKKLAFLPGSRRAEILSLMPIYRDICKNLGKEIEATLVIPTNFSQEKISQLYGDISLFKVSNDTHKTLYESDFAFICSGTATLEASLIGTPFILTYRAKAIDYFIAKKLVNIEYAGLANLFSIDFQNRPMHPEYIQDDLTLDNLLESYKNFDKSRFFEDVLKLRRYLRHGSSKEVANWIME